MNKLRTHIVILYLKRFIVALLVNSFTGFLVSLFIGKKVIFQGVWIDKKSLNYIQLAALIFNLYESKEILFLNNYLRNDLPCIELGSSIGIVSSQICKLSTQKKIFVEANPSLIKTIHSNLVLNQFDNFEIINAAIAYGEGTTVSFNFGDSNLTGNINQSKKEQVTVTKTSLKTILEQHPEINDFTLVMDIEGAELDLIEQEADSLINCKQIIAEFHDVNTTDKKISFKDIKDKYLQHQFKLTAEYYNRYVFER